MITYPDERGMTYPPEQAALAVILLTSTRLLHICQMTALLIRLTFSLVLYILKKPLVCLNSKNDFLFFYG